MAAKNRPKIKYVLMRGARAGGRVAIQAHKASGLGYMVAGGALMLLANSETVRNSSIAKYAWWVVPVGLLLAGIYLYRKGSKYGPAFLVAGAMLFVQYWQAQRGQTTAQPKPATDTTKGVDVTANGVSYRIGPDGTITMLGAGETGSIANDNRERATAESMASAVYGRRAA